MYCIMLFLRRERKRALSRENYFVYWKANQFEQQLIKSKIDSL